MREGERDDSPVGLVDGHVKKHTAAYASTLSWQNANGLLDWLAYRSAHKVKPPLKALNEVATGREGQ